MRSISPAAGTPKESGASRAPDGTGPDRPSTAKSDCGGPEGPAVRPPMPKRVSSWGEKSDGGGPGEGRERATAGAPRTPPGPSPAGSRGGQGEEGTARGAEGTRSLRKENCRGEIPGPGTSPPCRAPAWGDVPGGVSPVTRRPYTTTRAKVAARTAVARNSPPGSPLGDNVPGFRSPEGQEPGCQDEVTLVGRQRRASRTPVGHDGPWGVKPAA